MVVDEVWKLLVVFRQSVQPFPLFPWKLVPLEKGKGQEVKL